jgi:polar amino acid transport system substrate-binding protein
MFDCRNRIGLGAAALTLVAVLAASAEAAPSFTASGKLTVCTDPTFPPMEYFAQSGDAAPVGFDVDLINALAGHWSATAEIVPLDFAGLLPALEAKRCDAVISGIFVTPERLKNFDGVAYLSTASVLIAKGGEQPIAETAALSGKTVAVQTGTEFVQWMEDINKELAAAGKEAANAQLYPKASDVIQQVLLGRAYAGFTQDTEVAFRDLQNPGQLAAIYTFPERQNFGVYIRREGDDLAELKAAIDALRADGTLAGIVERWKLSADQLEIAP